MLTESGCRQRQANLWNSLPTDIHWVLIADPRHVQYFSGFRCDPVSFSADQTSALLLFRDGTSTLLADNFARRTAVSDVWVTREEIEPWYTHKRSVNNRHHATRKSLQRHTSGLDLSAGLVEAESVSLDLYQTILGDAQSSSGSSLSVNCLIRQLRRQKLEDEQQLLQRCMDAGAAGHQAAFATIQPGVTELDVYLAVQQAAQDKAGLACVVYGDFRATNGKMFKAGGLPTQYVLQEGDLFIVDYSVVIAGYRSDYTNTIAVGTPTAEQEAQAAACIDALAAAEACLNPGGSSVAVFDAVDRTLKDRGFEGLVHHAGHGLGMEHPEPPILVSESTDELLVNDVVTVEPGLYVEGRGGMRFEHNYRITEAGYERMSHHHLGLMQP